jgi:hypothetical protein
MTTRAKVYHSLAKIPASTPLRPNLIVQQQQCFEMNVMPHFLVFDSADDLSVYLKTIVDPTKSYLSEVFGHVPVKAFFDIDGDSTDGNFNFTGLIEELLASFMLFILQKFPTYKVNREEFIVINMSENYLTKKRKSPDPNVLHYSAHVIHNGSWCFENIEFAKILMLDFVGSHKEHQFTKFIDTKVYRPNGNLRLPFALKYGEDESRRKTVPEGFTLAECLVGVYDKSDKCEFLRDKGIFGQVFPDESATEKITKGRCEIDLTIYCTEKLLTRLIGSEVQKFTMRKQGNNLVRLDRKRLFVNKAIQCPCCLLVHDGTENFLYCTCTIDELSIFCRRADDAFERKLYGDRRNITVPWTLDFSQVIPDTQFKCKTVEICERSLKVQLEELGANKKLQYVYLHGYKIIELTCPLFQWTVSVKRYRTDPNKNKPGEKLEHFVLLRLIEVSPLNKTWYTAPLQDNNMVLHNVLMHTAFANSTKKNNRNALPENWKSIWAGKNSTKDLHWILTSSVVHPNVKLFLRNVWVYDSPSFCDLVNNLPLSCRISEQNPTVSPSLVYENFLALPFTVNNLKVIQETIELTPDLVEFLLSRPVQEHERWQIQNILSPKVQNMFNHLWRRTENGHFVLFDEQQRDEWIPLLTTTKLKSMLIHRSSMFFANRLAFYRADDLVLFNELRKHFASRMFVKFIVDNDSIRPITVNNKQKYYVDQANCTIYIAEPLTFREACELWKFVFNLSEQSFFRVNIDRCGEHFELLMRKYYFLLVGEQEREEFIKVQDPRILFEASLNEHLGGAMSIPNERFRQYTNFVLQTGDLYNGWKMSSIYLFV